MLPAAQRLTDADTFRHASRQGRRTSSRTVVLHLTSAGTAAPVGSARVGFVVSKAVGNAVVRNRVKRRLRHLMRDHMSSLPPAALLVVRALPAAAAASSAELGRDLERCLSRGSARNDS